MSLGYRGLLAAVAEDPMGKHERVDVASVDDLGPSEAVANGMRRGDTLTLHFPALLSQEIEQAAIERFARALPDCSVFGSFGTRTPTRVAILAVVTRGEIEERVGKILASIENYWATCDSLLTRQAGGSLSEDWWGSEHGEHCRFENRAGQVVEALLQESPHFGRLAGLDPEFYSEFVRTTPGEERVAELLLFPFHDAARIIDVLRAR